MKDCLTLPGGLLTAESKKRHIGTMGIFSQSVLRMHHNQIIGVIP